jgi:multimeric flavodoxin WrbA
MKIATILGSARKRGNTAAVLSMFEAKVASDHALERIDLADYSIEGCLGCDACQKRPGRLGCSRKDDAEGVFQKVLSSDLVIYASPVYVWDFSSQMKTFIDRHYCMVKWTDAPVPEMLMRGKRAALLATCGSDAAGNADLIQAIFDREMKYLGCEVLGKYIVDNCTVPAKLGTKAAETAERMAKDFFAFAERRDT